MLHVTLLIVEDEECMLNSLQMSMRPLFKKVYVAKNGEEAIEIMKDKDIDIVITDINMPVLSGIDVIRYAIEQHTPIIPAVVITGYDEFIQEWQDIDYIKVLHKPINIKILYDNIKAVLKSTECVLIENYCDSLSEMCDNAQILLDRIQGNYN